MALSHSACFAPTSTCSNVPYTSSPDGVVIHLNCGPCALRNHHHRMAAIVVEGYHDALSVVGQDGVVEVGHFPRLQAAEGLRQRGQAGQQALTLVPTIAWRRSPDMSRRGSLLQAAGSQSGWSDSLNSASTA